MDSVIKMIFNCVILSTTWQLMFLACDCGARTCARGKLTACVSVYGCHSRTQLRDIYLLMLLTPTTGGNGQPRAVCLTEQT